MAKLLRQAHALWRKDEDFTPHYESPTPLDPPPEVTTTSATITAPSPSGKRPPLNYTLLKSRLEILPVLRSNGWQEKTRRGSQLRGCCPLHDGDAQDRSFAVNTRQQTCCCHRCGEQGNALDLLVQLSQLPLHEAAWQWIDQQGLEAPLLNTKPIQKKRLSARA